MNKMEKQLGVIPRHHPLAPPCTNRRRYFKRCVAGGKLVFLCCSVGYIYVMRKRLANWGRGNGKDRHPGGEDHPHCKQEHGKCFKSSGWGFVKHPLLFPSTDLLIPVFYNNNTTTNQVSLEFRGIQNL